MVLFCSLAILDPRVSHTNYLQLSLSSVILIDSSTGSSVHVLTLSRPCVIFLACVSQAFVLELFLSPGNSKQKWDMVLFTFSREKGNKNEHSTGERTT